MKNELSSTAVEEIKISMSKKIMAVNSFSRESPGCFLFLGSQMLPRKDQKSDYCVVSSSQ